MMNHVPDRPSRRVLLQRVRNRIIEYLDVASSFAEQRAYQAQVPQLHVPNEVISQWEDWVSEAWEMELVEPVFSYEERLAIAQFYSIWKTVTEHTPDPLPDLEVMLTLPVWEQLRDGADALLIAFGKRGKLSEEREEI